MAAHEFGGSWTQDKLNRLRGYLEAYAKIFARNPGAQKLSTIYLDAFAGTGYRTQRSRGRGQTPWFPELAAPDTEGFLKGSARIALEVDPPLTRYIFIEQRKRRAEELEKLRREFPRRAHAVGVVQQDANGYLKEWCAHTDWKAWRAVVFLDPYGMEVEWSTIEAMAETRAIDLWVLFPLGPVMRLLTKRELPQEASANALTRSLGTESWRTFYQKGVHESLFGHEEMETREADFEKIGRFFVDRLKTVFSGVAENPLPLRNSKNVPLYLLCFAAGNPRGSITALKIAQYILGR